jgi:L-ascorbate metabolism protein UlaG (beta-lactamase superfamily)
VKEEIMKKRYENSEKVYKLQAKEIFPLIMSLIKEKSKDAKPKSTLDIPVKFLNKQDLEALENYCVIRFGHSTLLFKIENEFILTDPVFSKRASPFSFMGPKRFHDMPISIEELPFIDSVIISHDHYDHLDKQSIKKLVSKVGKFYTTLEVGKHLMKFGVSRQKIVELDWWESSKPNNIEFVCTPAQHFSGRGLFDRDKTLWSSWVIKAPKGRFYFGADGGYFNCFKEIAYNHGSFDMTFLEVGAYNQKWRDIHMLPHESAQAHKDLRGKVMFPIHNGTFDLALHAWYEPFEKIASLAKDLNIDIVFPKMGEAIPLLTKKETSLWWKS